MWFLHIIIGVMKPLAISSFVFLSNFVHNTFYKEWIYAWIFLLLTTTSLFIHSGLFDDDVEFENQMIYLDKTIISTIFFYGLYLYMKSLSKKKNYFPFLSISIVMWFYIGGYFLDKYCFDPNLHCAEVYHAVIHIVGSLGHHSIMWEYATQYYTL